jgi:DNA-binding IclR family transcriptional regulator
MAEQPVNLSTVLYLGVFSRAEQRVLQAIFKAIAEGNGRCVATLAMLARASGASKSTTRNAINRAVEIGLLEKTERRFYCAVSLPNILTYGKADVREHDPDLLARRTEATVMRGTLQGRPDWLAYSPSRPF